jgi:hypothetical protein
MAWQKQTNYGCRALVELAMLRYKTIIGPKMKARKLSRQESGGSGLRARVKPNDKHRSAGIG